VRGVTLAHDKDEVVGMICVDDLESSVLVVSENGYGKRSSIEDYRITNRGGKGVKTINVTEKTGNLIALKNVTDENDLMVVNKSGITIRISVAQLREMGRATQGVRIIKLREGDSIAAVAKVPATKEEELEEGLVEGEVIENTDQQTPPEAASEEATTEE
ncbi:MAG: DNA gyrase subunit A, partial [Bacteroidetes bacterium]|nr:DNA gyrase subunit A [Bacteroidota bacterium]